MISNRHAAAQQKRKQSGISAGGFFNQRTVLAPWQFFINQNEEMYIRPWSYSEARGLELIEESDPFIYLKFRISECWQDNPNGRFLSSCTLHKNSSLMRLHDPLDRSHSQPASDEFCRKKRIEDTSAGFFIHAASLI
jgi:hypothetical protein